MISASLLSLNPTKKITYLRFFSVSVVILLGGIQFYLVRNSYKLTKDKYVKSITAQADSFQNDPAAVKAASAIFSSVLKLGDEYASGKIKRADLSVRLWKDAAGSRRTADSAWQGFIRHRPEMRAISYQQQYDQIWLKEDGRKDSLLSPELAPLKLLGHAQPSNGWLISDIHHDTEVLVNRAPGSNYKMIIRTSNLIYSTSQIEVFTRMLLTFVLSFGLIVAVILILFLNFKAIYQQKRIADMKSDFAGNITHELQTPVSTIAIIVKTLQNESVKTNPQLLDETVAALDRQHHRLKTSIDSVLESAMMEKSGFQREPLEMSAFLSAYLHDYPTAGHLFKLTPPPGPVTLHTGKQALERILRNILENALKYSPEGTMVHISTNLSAQYYTIAIRDEGPGIEKEHQRFIFDKFYRIPQHNLHTVKGLGIGLHLCHELIHQLGGFITLDSIKGKGSIFSIHLPR